MPFASTELAARIERAECRLIAAAVEAFARDEPGSEPFLREIAGGVAAFTAEGLPINKLAGLGFDGPFDDAELEAVERELARRAGSLQVEVSTLAERGVVERLTRRGYVLMGFENVLGRALPVSDELVAGSGIALERLAAPVGEERFAAWLEVVVRGFGAADAQGVASHEEFDRAALTRAIGSFARSEGMRLYLATRDGAPAGGGSMRLTDGIAQLSGAATLPEHRRRGIQSLLLARRLADAAAAGCDLAVVVTQPGSKSQQNVQRQGFDLLYSRAVLVREW